MNPWPGAFTLLPDREGVPRKLKVFEAAETPRSGQPGHLLSADGHGLLVACSSGSLLLREIQMEGKRRMTAREFLMGHTIQPGAILGHGPQ
jgi:methionyl-tRNA formyltransferase